MAKPRTRMATFVLQNDQVNMMKGSVVRHFHARQMIATLKSLLAARIANFNTVTSQKSKARSEAVRAALDDNLLTIEAEMAALRWAVALGERGW